MNLPEDYEPVAMTKERLEELKKDSSNVVYEYQTTKVDALPLDQVKEYTRRVYLFRIQFERDGDDEKYTEASCRDALTKAAEGDGVFHRFVTYTHTPFVDLLLKPRSGIREFRNALHMIEVKARMNSGEGGNELLEAYKKRLLDQYTT
jgi:hypothetical protein